MEWTLQGAIGTSTLFDTNKFAQKTLANAKSTPRNFPAVGEVITSPDEMMNLLIF